MVGYAFLLLVYGLPWSLQHIHQDDISDSGPPRTKRGVAKGSQTKRAILYIPCLQHVDTTMFRGRIAILRLGCGPRLSNSSPRKILGRKRELSNVPFAPD